MNQFLGREYKDCVKSLQVKNGVSKEGSNYNYISIVLVNGYEKRLYLQSAEQFAFRNAFESLDTTKQFELNSQESAF